MTHYLNLKKDVYSKAIIQYEESINDEDGNVNMNMNMNKIQPYLHQIEIQVPKINRNNIEYGSEIMEIIDQLKQKEYNYYLINLNLVEFLKPKTKDISYKNIFYYYLQKGVVSAKSYSINNETEDTFCIDNNSMLYLNLSKDTYYQLGLIGKKIKIDNNSIERFIVKLDLKSEELNEESSYYKRVVNCFENVFNKNIPFLMTFVDEETKEDMNISKLITEMKDTVEIKKYIMKCNYEPIWETVLPETKNNQILDYLNNIEDIVEWSGIISNSINNTVINDNNNESTGEVIKLHWNGYLSYYQMESILEELSLLIKIIQQNNSTQSIPFLSFTMYGFEDSIISWYYKNNIKNENNEDKLHYYSLSGENITQYYFLFNLNKLSLIDIKIANGMERAVFG
ncbi:hypothetical protein K502DRAFT_326212 [Neoconidiobolus thromboides FSU 785]|nr:hypothetical protein K502DRAFT_326212 [Neoconidiobolus thromboides FSU 785]